MKTTTLLLSVALVGATAALAAQQVNIAPSPQSNPLPQAVSPAPGAERSATPASAQAPITGTRTAVQPSFAVTPVADFDTPWAMTFLPDRRMLVTEKKGQLKLVSADGRGMTVVAGTPAVDSAGQGGLMDVVPHPKFASNRMVYLSWSEAGSGGKRVALGRGRLASDGSRLEAFTTIYRAGPAVVGNGHYAGRIAFAPDGHLFFTAGDRQKFTPAQDPKATLGKVVRLTDTGQPARGNPLAARGFDPAIWSVGHRNPLGIAFDGRGRLWVQEMGPQGGDELNLVLPARNYGYPIVSNGDHYDGEPVADKIIPDHPTRPEFEAPKVSWNPVISPAGLMVYTGRMFPAWRGNIFIGGLSSQALVRVAVNGDTAREAERYDLGARIREVEQGPDGAVYVLEDGRSGSQGRLLRLTARN